MIEQLLSGTGQQLLQREQATEQEHMRLLPLRHASAGREVVPGLVEVEAAVPHLSPAVR